MAFFETYLHGFQYLTFQVGRFYAYRNVFFTLCILGATGLFGYQTWLNVAAYLKFAVATAVSFRHLAYGFKKAAVDFPAITILNNNMYLVDAVGYPKLPNAGILPNIVALAQAQLQPPTPALVRAAMTQCVASPSAQIPTVFNNFWGNLLLFQGSLGMVYAMNVVGTNSLNSVLACRWQGKPINCADLFLNRMSDQGYCFTFYPSTGVLDSYNVLDPAVYDALQSTWFENDIPPCWREESQIWNYTANCSEYLNISLAAYQTTAFGTTKAQIEKYNLSTSSAGPRSGLQLLMNVQSQQYCTGSVQNTFGFVAFVHDRDVAPLLFFAHGIELPAGFTVNIAISVTSIDRSQTESIGNCVSDRALPWYPNMKTYSKDACQLECLSLIVNDSCKCIPFFAPPALVSTSYALHNPCPGGPYWDCFGELSFGYNYTAYNVSDECKKTAYASLGCLFQTCDCPYACTETKYTTDVSFSPLESPEAYQSLLDGETVGAMDIEEFRKTYVLANFYYKSLDITLITETQAVLLTDVVNGIGGVFGLCLGGSMITLVEMVVNGILPLVRYAFKKCRDRRGRVSTVK